MSGMMSSGYGAPQGASGHAKLFLQSTVGNHPVAAAAAIGVLVVAVIVLAFFVVKYKPAATPAKTGSFVTSMNNMTHGGARPLWHLGNGDAGNGGSMHRAPTAYHTAVTQPGRKAGAPLCGGWSADAGDEARALASVGGFQHDSLGEASLQRAVSSAYDSGSGGVAGAVDDLTLSDVMHKGGASP